MSRKVKLVAVFDCEIEDGDPLFDQMKRAFDGSNPDVRLILDETCTVDIAIESRWKKDSLTLIVAEGRKIR